MTDNTTGIKTSVGYNTFSDYRASFSAQSDTITPTQKRLFTEIMKANSNWWQVWDAEDRARFSEMNNYLRKKYGLS